PRSSTNVRGVTFAMNGMPVRIPCCRRFFTEDTSCSNAAVTAADSMQLRATTQQPVTNVRKIKNPQGLAETLRIAPASSPSPFPSPRGKEVEVYDPGQVVWL